MTLDPNNVIAERVRQSLRIFPLKFRELKEGGELERVLTTEKTLRGPLIEQAPEVFTEQYLVEPVLHALGYRSPTSKKYKGEGPHFVRRPTTFDKVEPKQPDYLLKNVDKSVVCLVEVKAANNEQMGGSKTKATDDIRAYIEDNAFCKYLRDLEERYLVGIGTDGVRWTLWYKDLKTRETHKHAPKIDLTPVITATARRNQIIAGEPELSRPEQRAKLRDEFTPLFAARTLPGHVSGNS